MSISPVTNFYSGVSLNKSKLNTKTINTVNFGEMIKPDEEQYNDLRVFYHHIYEYKKGLRNLVLTTEKKSNADVITDKLKREKIPFLINDVNGRNINVFFGNKDCIRVVSTFDKMLNKLTPEQDFMLGIMLGYDKINQCKRYFVMSDKYNKMQNQISYVNNQKPG